MICANNIPFEFYLRWKFFSKNVNTLTLEFENKKNTHVFLRVFKTKTRAKKMVTEIKFKSQEQLDWYRFLWSNVFHHKNTTGKLFPHGILKIYTSFNQNILKSSQNRIIICYG